MTVETAAIAGVSIHRVTLQDALKLISEYVSSGVPHQIVTVNLDFLRIARKDEEFREILNAAPLAIADGMPLIWISRWLKQPLPERIAGVDLLERVAALAASDGHRLFLLGAAEGVAAQAALSLETRHPGLNVAGTYAPPFGPITDFEQSQILSRIRAASPDVLFVAFGAPRQEHWIWRHLDELGVPVCVGVGGSFDIIAGRLSRAPRWMQTSGFEWLYRLALEPGRLWRRYLLKDLPLLLTIARGRYSRQTQGTA
jgi:N-acetylglucosaminyldiphosphoundecaprenol N-acetyl-beta-D-mannosaminyltransferase